MIPAREAIDRLKKGNQRFVLDQSTQVTANPQRRVQLANGQSPYAIIVGCSDSRVPVELVFDQGLGDLFVIRVAGNVVAPTQIGSVEFAVSMFNCALVVVLGHSHCGAIEATLEAIRQPQEHCSPNLLSIVDRIKPVVNSLLETPLESDQDQLIHNAVRANIRASVDQLTQCSKMLEQRIKAQQLMVIGAEYDLDTGQVEFFDGLAE